MGAGMLIGGLALSALSGGAGIVQANRQKKELKAQAASLDAQARNENARANDAFRRGETEARQRSQRLAQLQGSNRSGFAGAGLLVGEGGGETQADVWDTNANNAALDIASINDQTKSAMDQHDFAAAQLRTQAGALRQQGKQALRGAWTKAGIGMAASLASWGLGEWGGSLFEGGKSLFEGGKFLESEAMMKAGMNDMVKGSLIQSGGSVLAGIGGGSVGQGLYETGIRTRSAMRDFNASQKRSGKQSKLLSMYGGF